MTAKKHTELLLYSFVTWLTFYTIGLPEYYQQWYLWAKVSVVVAVTVIYFPITKYTLETYWDDGKYITNSCWLSLYLTIPLFVYDYLLLGWYQGLGISFVIPYWYLTFFYFSFWIQFPATAFWMSRQESGLTTEEAERDDLRQSAVADD